MSCRLSSEVDGFGWWEQFSPDCRELLPGGPDMENLQWKGGTDVLSYILVRSKDGDPTSLVLPSRNPTELKCMGLS